MKNEHRHEAWEAIKEAFIPFIKAAIYAAVIGFCAVVGMAWGSRCIKDTRQTDQKPAKVILSLAGMDSARQVPQ